MDSWLFKKIAYTAIPLFGFVGETKKIGMIEMKIAVVIVTYNRLDCLKNALSKYENQTLQPCYMIVVDNASTDGTYEFLEEWLSVESDINKIVVHNPKNTGGSGGFYLGLKESLKYDYDFVFLDH